MLPPCCSVSSIPIRNVGVLQTKDLYKLPVDLLNRLTDLYFKPAYGVPFVSNIAASQRSDGSNSVDIYYDLEDSTGVAMVTLDVSSDGGTTWNITPQPEHLSGDVGKVASGTGKHIVWNMGADKAFVFGAETKFRVVAYTEAFKAHEEKMILLPGEIPLYLVHIPAGTFVMGGEPEDSDSDSDEKPQHEVCFERDFCVGKYAVTQAQWASLMKEWPGLQPSSVYGKGDMYPAYHISWDDAQDFVCALNAHIAATGQEPLTVHLPSEAQWEYACRAGTTTRFPWGNDPDYKKVGQYAWFWDNCDGRAHPVGEKQPNSFGLYGMNGNVFEWCEDDWHYDYGEAPEDGSAWLDTPRTTNRVMRGGCWCSYFRDCRSTYRNCSIANVRNYAFGFRIAATLPSRH